MVINSGKLSNTCFFRFFSVFPVSLEIWMFSSSGKREVRWFLLGVNLTRLRDTKIVGKTCLSVSVRVFLLEEVGVGISRWSKGDLPSPVWVGVI